MHFAFLGSRFVYVGGWIHQCLTLTHAPRSAFFGVLFVKAIQSIT